ncbi:hypothetical protein [uncultured Dubosiella sp.]|uniref:hypothetical protein n=3 Tax=uncultured Dubosiella sp. TaxID=1937011 RepID=UPI002619C395|nr:hypothetical protein [uncultured Dubosiella sp.]
MKEKILTGIQWFDKNEKYLLSAAGILYVALTILSWCLLFKLSDSMINEMAVIGLSVIRKCVFIVFGCTIANDIYHKRLDWKLAGGFFSLSVLVTFFSKNAEPVKMVFAILALSRLPFQWTLRDFYNAQRFILLLVVVMAALGVIENALYDKERMRFGLGFDSSSTSAVLLFHILVFYECIRSRKWTNSEVYLYVLSIMLIYIATNSRFIFIMSLLYLAAIWIRPHIKKKYWTNQWTKRILTVLPFAILAGSLLLFAIYDSHNTIWQSLNDLFSDRFKYGHEAMFKYGFTVFGQPIVWSGNNYFNLPVAYNYVDNSYVKFILEFGVVFALVYLGFISFGLWNFFKKGSYRKIIALTFLVIMGTVESFLFMLVFNPFLIYGFKMMNDWVMKRTAQRRLERSL